MKPLNLPYKFYFKPIVCLFCILCTWMTQSKAQSATYAHVDSTTYALYLEGKWNSLIEEGIQAIHTNTDYFYLRMRIAYAYYRQGKYRQAIPHYNKALAFNSSDIDAQYLLMQCYEFAGRKNDALKFSADIDEKQLPDISLRYNSDIYTAGLVYSICTSNSNTIESQIVNNKDLSKDGIQTATNYFHDVNTFISHRLGKSIIVHHGFEYIYKNDFIHSIEDGEEELDSHSLRKQWNYGVKIQLTPWLGSSVTPGINIIWEKAPYQEAEKYIDNTFLYSCKFDHDLLNIKLGASWFNAKLNSIKTTQLGGHLIWYPKSNLNIYYSLDAYWHQQKHEGYREISFNHKHVFGFRITDYWWTEASALFPSVNNFYDFNIAVLYNSLEGSKNTFGLTNIFLINNSNLSLLTGIYINKGVSQFVTDDLPLAKTNLVDYNKITFSGGLIWKL